MFEGVQLGCLAVFYVRRCSVWLSGIVFYQEVFSLALAVFFVRRCLVWLSGCVLC